MPCIKIKISKLVSQEFPGFVQCSFVDVYNKEWTFIEKVPVITYKDINANTIFPLEEFIPVEIIREWNDNSGKQLVTVSIEKPWDIQADGKTQFDFSKQQIFDFDYEKQS